MNQEKYDLIKAGKYKQVVLMDKISYWETQKRKAEHFIKKYNEDLERLKK